MEYVAIVISSLALIAIIVAIVLIVKNSKQSVQPSQVDLKEIGMLQQQLNSLSNELKTNIKLSVSEEINKPAVKFNWLRRNNWGLYSKVGVGYTRAEFKTTGEDSNGTYTKDSSGDNFFNFQASLVGVEAGNRSVRGFAELGFGEQGVIHGGIRFRF